MLEAAGAELVNRAEEIGELLSREMGKPRSAAIDEVRRPEPSLRIFCRA